MEVFTETEKMKPLSKLRSRTLLSSPSGTRRKRVSGQAVVETALVLPILLILSLMVVQYGIIAFTAVALTNLAREGARFAATTPQTDAAIKERIQAVRPPSILWRDIERNIVITPRQGDYSRATGTRQLITVEISYNMANKMFLPRSFFGIRIFNTNYKAKASMMIE